MGSCISFNFRPIHFLISILVRSFCGPVEVLPPRRTCVNQHKCFDAAAVMSSMVYTADQRTLHQGGKHAVITG